MIVIHNHKGGNNYSAAKIIADHFGCNTAAVENQPCISCNDTIIFVIPNVGDEELPQPMEDFLSNLTVVGKNYIVCELGNYFGLERYCGCKKVAFRILDALNWRRISDVSIDSLPSLDVETLKEWLSQIPKIK